MLNFGRFRLEAAEPVEVSTRAVDLVLGTVVIDMLGLLTLDWSRLAGWLAQPGTFDAASARRLHGSGIDVFHPAVETGARDPYLGAMGWVTGWNRLLDGTPCELVPVLSRRDLERPRGNGEIGVVVGFQNSDHFRTVADVEAFARLGQRVSQLTYNERNRLGSGCYVLRDRGLTRFGAEVVGEMDRVGMAVDVSHCGERTSLDAIGLSRHPVLVTHANCAALVSGQPRCKSDRVIRALARRGGVMGITAVRDFVGRSHATLDGLLDHFDHVARLVGVEHAGLGSDVDVDALDPRTGRVRAFYSIRGLDPGARVYQIADGLLRRGYSERDVAGVLGGNFARALAEIWPAGPAPRPDGIADRRDPFCPAPDLRPPEKLVARR